MPSHLKSSFPHKLPYLYYSEVLSLYIPILTVILCLTTFYNVCPEEGNQILKMRKYGPRAYLLQNDQPVTDQMFELFCDPVQAVDKNEKKI